MATNDTGIFSLQWKDVVKSVILFFITTVLTSAVEWFSNGGFPTWAQIKGVLLTSASASIAYLIKNLLTNNKDQFAKPDVPTS